MDIEKSREEFESWVKSKWPDTYLERIPEKHHLAGNYWEVNVQMTWVAWQASRETLVVELPAIDDPDCGQRVSFHLGAYKGQCRQAIHAAGVKTK